MTNSGQRSASDGLCKETPNNEYAVEGLRFWLNNKPEQSEQHFRARLTDTPILAGYAFILCMNGVISYEIDKIEEAQKILKELEKRCLSIDESNKTYSMYESTGMRSSWLSNVRQKIFGNILNAGSAGSTDSQNKMTKSTMQLIEEQIILADTYLSMAILTFLMHDIPGLMKGGWLLRKSWKIYQKTYLQLYDMYASGLPEHEDKMLPKPSNYSRKLCMTTSKSFFSIRSPTTPNTDSIEKAHMSSTETSSLSQTTEDQLNSRQINNTQKNSPPSKQNLRLNLKSQKSYECQPPLTCPVLPSHIYPESDLCFVDCNDVHRLMGAVSFGYGLFQLISSLLPNKILKVISIFGFQGNRDIGMACLKFARLSIDMRSALATLVLLWFYSFGTQLFQYEDGYSEENINMVTDLLNESEEEYGESAIFLFFRGRLHRIKSKIQKSIEAFEKSYNVSVQRELKLLCLHEIAWCRLIQLDFSKADKHFNDLREFSVFSKVFYTYITAICQGACGNYTNMNHFRDEIVNLLCKSENYKQTHIIRFVQNRVSKFPRNDEEHQCIIYWRLLCYEMLYLWNALSNVEKDDLKTILQDFSLKLESPEEYEPMIGLKDLILGATYANLKEFTNAAAALSRVIETRERTPDEAVHISAFAHYELAAIIKQLNQNDSQKIHEAKQLLRNAQKFQNYDFENRLNVQIQQELKKF